MILLGIDPGQNTGLAIFDGGRLAELRTITPVEIDRAITSIMPGRVVFEDSRLQSHLWTTSTAKATLAKIARNVGEVDAWCKLIVAVCAGLDIPAHSVSPLGKGKKMAADQFQRITGWDGPSNQHCRDAAMVAWPYRGAK